MSNNKYKKAPVSEVIFGVTFENNELLRSKKIFELILKYSEQFPEIQTLSPIPNVPNKEANEENNQINISFNPPGSLYRMWSNDRNWLLQLQYNKIYLNWVRPDTEGPGKYPGFTKVFEKFESVYDNLKNFKIEQYELTYLDRIDLNDLNELSRIDEIFEFKLPTIINSDPRSFASNFKFSTPDIEGHTDITINTKMLMTGHPAISFQCTIRGMKEKCHEFFNITRKKQIQIFEDFFNKKILESWK